MCDVSMRAHTVHTDMHSGKQIPALLISAVVVQSQGEGFPSESPAVLISPSHSN